MYIFSHIFCLMRHFHYLLHGKKSQSFQRKHSVPAFYLNYLYCCLSRLIKLWALIAWNVPPWLEKYSGNSLSGLVARYEPLHTHTNACAGVPRLPICHDLNVQKGSFLNPQYSRNQSLKTTSTLEVHLLKTGGTECQKEILISVCLESSFKQYYKYMKYSWLQIIQLTCLTSADFHTSKSATHSNLSTEWRWQGLKGPIFVIVKTVRGFTLY